MGVIWSIVCWRHREEFDAGKFYELADYGPDLRESNDIAVRNMKRDMQEVMRKPDSLGRRLAERQYSLMTAFIERHKDCSLMVENDATPSRRYKRVLNLEIAEWKAFSVFQDMSIAEIEDQMEKEKTEEWLEKLRNEIQELESKSVQTQMSEKSRAQSEQKLGELLGDFAFWKGQLARSQNKTSEPTSHTIPDTIQKGMDSLSARIVKIEIELETAKGVSLRRKKLRKELQTTRNVLGALQKMSTIEQVEVTSSGYSNFVDVLKQIKNTPLPVPTQRKR